MMKILIFFLFFYCFSMMAETVVFLGSSSDSGVFAAAFRELRLPERIKFESYCVSVDPWETIVQAAKRADILILNARGKELRELAEREVDYSRTRLYAFSSRLLTKKIPVQEPQEMKDYRENSRPENFRNLVYWIVNRELDSSVKFALPISLPEIGATHPAAKRIFSSLAEYREWGERSGHLSPGGGLLAFAVHAASVNSQEMALFQSLTDECERQKVNVVIVYGDEVRVIRKLLLNADGKPLVDAVLALSFKFKSGLGEQLRLAIKDLDVPVFNALRLYRQTTPEWEKSVRGMNDFSVAFGFIAPEISGLIEPSLLFGSRQEVNADGGKVQRNEPFPEQIRQTVSRLKKWIELRHKSNADKHVAFFIYNGSGGKQNIGASYLNVPRSLVHISGALFRAGYQTGGLETLDEEKMTAELLKNARNVGSWAPGELDEFLTRGEVVRLSRKKYEQWFAALPEALRNAVSAEWGPLSEAKIMVSGNDFILPMFRRGNIVILPEPMRGWLDDPHKLIHSSTLAPPHQYLAVYLWLKNEFLADAMVHLGRHGSSEWLPGKQLGLSSGDAPMAVRGNIPEIYPYIADGIGEGIVAKRRASAVMIDHLTPFLKVPSAAAFLPELKSRLANCATADPAVLPVREKALRKFAAGCGLDKRLDLNTPGWRERLEEYAGLVEAPAPFGLHSFGESPQEVEISAMTAMLPEKERSKATSHLRNAGKDELNALLHALSGGFVEPGPSGDAVRNPAMLPVGRNFYSFDPAKVPTPEALQTGAKLAAELLAKEQQKLGRFPRSVAVVLWAGESIRTDGVNEGMILALMGMTLRYDSNGRVISVAPIPGAALKHPRIDVLTTTSGAYRDQFGDLIRLLDRARRQAARLRDAENFIREETPGIFFPAPGTYGTRINKLAGASGVWENESELAALYLKNMAYSLDGSGNFSAQPDEFTQALSGIESVVHSRSSNVYGVSDIDEMYQYLGGLSLTVRTLSGQAPSAYIADQRKKSHAALSGLQSFMGAELDSRLFNREWIQAMLQENYAGGKTLARMADNVWGWQAVAPEQLPSEVWSEMYDIYVKDRYDLKLKDFFARNNEWAFQSMTGRMLEAVRKNYWQTDLKTRQSLAAEYAQSVIRQGMACCDHTCNNPLLNQMVVNLISMPGVLAPDSVMKFQAAVEKAAGKTLGDQVRERRELQKSLATSFGSRNAQVQNNPSAQTSPQTEQALNPGEAVPVKGFKMKPSAQTADKTSLSSSGLKWTILIAVLGLIGVFACGCFKHER